MKAIRIRLPHLLFIYTAIVLAALLCICLFYMEKAALEEDLLKWQNEASELKQELKKLKRYTQVYDTDPDIVALVLNESERYNMDPGIMLELIKTESDFNPKAVSPQGALGLCQIMPQTGKELAAELQIPYYDGILFKQEINIRLGTYYLAKLLQTHDNDYHKALTAYNRGPTGMLNYMKQNGTAVSEYSMGICINSPIPAL